jgi:hypothetical protein
MLQNLEVLQQTPRRRELPRPSVYCRSPALSSLAGSLLACLSLSLKEIEPTRAPSNMAKVLNFYMDDSGARHPDHKPGKRASHGYDWFSLGGILVKEDDEPKARRLHAAFCGEWGIEGPIHSVEVRGRTEGFLWLEHCDDLKRTQFLEALYQLMRRSPVIGLACVIDRPGYNDRYREKYGGDRWLLCKTAFNIATERAVKYARSIGCRRARTMQQVRRRFVEGILRGAEEYRHAL